MTNAPPLPIGRRLIDVIFWLALTLWLATNLAAGVNAAAAFIVLPDASVLIERYGALPAAQQSRLVAGLVTEPVFTIADLVQFVLVPVTVLALVVQLVGAGGRRARVTNVLRSLCIAGAAGLFLFRAVTVMPDLNGHLQSYRAAAEGGDLERAATERAAFDVIHPQASDLYQGCAMLLVLAVALSAFAAGGATTVKPALELAEPELASAYR
jgi:hypothetical protein